MKTLLTAIALVLSISLSYGQNTVKHKHVKKHNAILKKAPCKKTVGLTVPIRKLTFTGDFLVAKYHILSLNTPGTKVLQSIGGSLIKVTSTSVTGARIEPRTFNLTNSQLMSRGEFVTEVFGRELRVREPDLPDSILVHLTDNPLFIGFVEIDKDNIAVPYKGVLLFLERK